MKDLFCLFIIVFLLASCNLSPSENNSMPSTPLEENKPNTVSYKPLIYDLDVVNYLYLVSLYGNGVSFYPSEENTIYYSKIKESPQLPISTTEGIRHCFDHKNDCTFLILESSTEKGVFHLLFSNDYGKSWSINQLDFPNNLLEMYVSIIDESSAYLFFNTSDSKNNYCLYNINKNGEIQKEKLTFSFNADVIFGFSFISNKIGYVIGQNEKQPILFRTDDGGIQWKEIKPYIPENKNDSFFIPQIPCFYNNTGFMRIAAYYFDDAGNQKVSTYCYLSKDNGLTWELLFENVDEFSYSEQTAWEIISLFENNEIQ